MLSEEEKKAIEKLKETKDSYLKDELDLAIEIVLNLITKLQKENETTCKLNANMSKRHLNDIFKIKNYEKQIDLMAKKLNQAYFDEDKFCIWFEKMMGVQEKMDYGYVVDLIKQYFETKVKKGK